MKRPAVTGLDNVGVKLKEIYKMQLSELESTIGTWIDALAHYDFNVLQARPNKDSWSLGQVYMHILEDTNFYADQVESCLTESDNQSAEKNDFATRLFLNNDFPDERIKGNAAASQMPEPASKSDLVKQMDQLKTRLTSLWLRVENSNSTGKAKHPGMGYFNAREWLTFAEIHMRHHLRQKRRIEDAIRISTSAER
jgi:hypothetical protein